LNSGEDSTNYVKMEAIFAECHGVLEHISTLFSTLERSRGYENEKQLEDSIHLKLESLKR